MNRWFYFILVIFITAFNEKESFNSIDISGRWEGRLTQAEGGKHPEYKMAMVVRQNKNKLDGFVEVWVGEDVYVKHLVKGTITKGFFVELADIRQIQDKPLEAYSYCLKNYQLVYSRDDRNEYLNGRWQGAIAGNKCIPGQVFLVRVTDRA